MKRLMTTIIAASILGTAPIAMAAPAEAGPLPKVLSDFGVTAEDLRDVGKVMSEKASASEAEMMRHRWGRYCPRGYYLQRYYIRIGRFVIVRYRCVRRHHHPHYPHQIDQSTMERGLDKDLEQKLEQN